MGKNLQPVTSAPSDSIIEVTLMVVQVILEVIMEDEGTMVMLMTPGNLEVKVKTAQ
jgi:hypothetical protein